jgi:2-oxoglutarate dehydrogenase E2 component (dihydrolipoamide succinyltransferase)
LPGAATSRGQRQIQGDEIVYHDYVDISVAVSAPNGLVVPVVRNAMPAQLCRNRKGDCRPSASAPSDGTLTMEDMKGGTFTISNGGVFRRADVHPDHQPAAERRARPAPHRRPPVVRDGQIVIRPMMYLALSYDHRLIDGREAVTASRSSRKRSRTPPGC